MQKWVHLGLILIQKKLIKVLAYVNNDKSNNIPIGKIKTIFLLSKKCLKM